MGGLAVVRYLLVASPFLFSQLIATTNGEDNSKVTQCCQNGGRCILESFCVCLQHFYGRYCEYQLLKRSCGPLKHGTWLRYKCDLCWCFDGRFQCLQQVFRGCSPWPKSDLPLTYESLDQEEDIQIYPLIPSDQFPFNTARIILTSPFLILASNIVIFQINFDLR